MSVLVVGAGFTASVLCRSLRASSPELTLTVWEKTRGAGGRQATKRIGNYSCDIGAQYLTHWTSDKFFEPYVAELRKNNVIVPFKGKVENPPAKYSGDCQHYVAPKGMSSLSRLFLSGTNTHFSHNVQSIRVDQITNKIIVGTDKGRSAVFDAVVLTIPAPGLLDITMDPPLTNEVEENISKMVFTPRFSLMLVYDDVPHFDWIMKYQNDHMIRFLSWDHHKRRNGIIPTLLVQSSEKHALNACNTKNDEEITQELMTRLKELYPEITEPMTRFLKVWEHGQIRKRYEGNKDFLVFNECPLIMAGGASFVDEGYFSGVARSAEGLSKSVTNLLKTRGCF